MLVAGLVMSLSLQAAPQGEAWVVVSRRSGVAAPKAIDVAGQLAATLRSAGVVSPAAAEDLSACAGKKPCLVEAGRKKGVAVMVLLEVGTVLDDGFARAEAVSVEEDGRKLGVAECEGAVASLGKGISDAATRSLVGPLKTALGASPVAAPPPPPPLVTTTPAPPPPPLPAPEPKAVAAVPPPPATTGTAPADAPQGSTAPPATATPTPAPQPASASAGDAQPTKPSSHGPFRVPGLVAAGVGVAAIVASGVIGGGALGNTGTLNTLCPAGQPCTNAAAYEAYARAAQAQNAAVFVAGVGAGVAAVGALLFFLDPGAPAQVAVVPMRDGAVAAVSGQF